MFYSQFILAKKGPLGTIWIAAHLERKLRKNQVADTDIGVSVDSILFPEVPIALRLSSHLLLGVVRIYSRKVNYLFHDCSEALLKIKQAFRSTAVDLPPEESTAPYHSITLPETFDLDDFELPDFGFSHGNYVDHHISTKEQITLQDTTDDMFLSSQFGLDERFGDGDAPQLALDFDEDMFFESVHSPAHTTVLLSLEDNVCDPVKDQTRPFINSVELDEDDQTKTSITSMECDERQQDLTVTQQSGSAERTEQFPSLSIHEQVNLLESGGNGSADLIDTGIQIPKLIEDFLPCAIDQEQLPDSQEVLCSPTVMGESGIHNENDYPSPAAQAPSTPGLTEVIPVRIHGVSSVGNARKDSLLYPGDTLLEESCNSMPSDNGSNGGNIMESLMPTDTVDSSLIIGDSDGAMEIEQGANNIQIIVPNNAAANGLQGLDALPCATATLGSCNAQVVNSSEATSQEILEDLTAVKDVECKDYSAPHQIVAVVSAAAAAAGTCASDIVLRPCNGVLQTTQAENLLDKSAEEFTLNKVEDRGLDLTQLEHAHEQESEYPQLETLCSAPSETFVPPEDLVAQDFPAGDSSLSSEKGMFVGGTISGKKRMSMDSSPILPHGNPSKTSKFSQSARSVDFIPDDDDVLASILVGRRTPTFKIKSTPTSENVSSRRPRASAKASAQKRKVLLDDIMVLHGDIIRQQLTVTEDIRRLRRKAPCTSLDIWKIQKLALTDDIFCEPLLSGVSTKITSLYSKAFVSTGEGVLSITSEGADPVDYLEFVKEPRTRTVDEPRSNSLESNCLQTEQSLDRVVANHNNMSHSSEGSQDAGGTLQHEPGICINGNSMNNGVHSDVQMENDMPAGSTVGEPLLGNEASGLSIPTSVVATDCTSELDNCHFGTGTGGDGVGPTGTEKHPDSSLDKSTPIEGDMLMMRPAQNKPVLVDIGDNESIEDRHILGEKSNTLTTDKPSSETDLQLQGDIDNGQSLTIIPGDVQSGHDVSKEIESLNSSGSAGGNHDGNMHDNTADECPRNDNVMGSHGDIRSIEHVDVDNVAPCQDSQDYEAQVDPMHTEDASDQIISRDPALDNDNTVQQDASVGKCMDQFQILGCVADENAIEFLNEDDMPDVEEDGAPNMSTADREKLEDNSGWSIRTRGVAKYLKSLFESIESNSNKLGLASQKSVPLDRLLVGKSRKEASRMFFETLVLKTRDYIHVEQPDPFDSIDIGPKLRLMKSEF